MAIRALNIVARFDGSSLDAGAANSSGIYSKMLTKAKSARSAALKDTKEYADNMSKYL